MIIDFWKTAGPFVYKSLHTAGMAVLVAIATYDKLSPPPPAPLPPLVNPAPPPPAPQPAPPPAAPSLSPPELALAEMAYHAAEADFYDGLANEIRLGLRDAKEVGNRFRLRAFAVDDARTKVFARYSHVGLVSDPAGLANAYSATAKALRGK